MNIYGEKNPHVASADNNLAFIYAERNELDKAKEYFLKSFELKKELLGKDHPDVGLALNNLGYVEIRIKDYKTAIDDLKAAVIQLEKSYPENHIWFARTYHWLGTAYNDEGEFKIAENYNKKALDIRRKNYEEGNHLIYQTEGELGISYLGEKKLNLAEKYLIEAYNGYVVLNKQEDEFSERYLSNLVKLYKSKSDTLNENKFLRALKTAQLKKNRN